MYGICIFIEYNFSNTETILFVRLYGCVAKLFLYEKPYIHTTLNDLYPMNVFDKKPWPLFLQTCRRCRGFCCCCCRCRRLCIIRFSSYISLNDPTFSHN